ncbi:hypothetical protein M427DRAFT_131455 [Gonapodya prolifera JEL478]|uniref:Xylanolytic transcriptional activator regulatory domain-containing protein n=1 Tax=Gonapodya prolifera (strain JEL478) TaxID=1344416 RepID=A0A139ATV4_GONPJ|nr:hypothetical protein M427DRAFT_131455 [Gonapodya prolifera JEL478]|eukprot:KXS20013.1 hypothetical protein M427DRAFT_131455 [Gonapodya prolifera JEL478]
MEEPGGPFGSGGSFPVAPFTALVEASHLASADPHLGTQRIREESASASSSSPSAELVGSPRSVPDNMMFKAGETVVYHGIKVSVDQFPEFFERRSATGPEARLQHTLAGLTDDQILFDPSTPLWIRLYQERVAFLFPIFPGSAFSNLASFPPILMFSMMALGSRYYHDSDVGLGVAEVLFERARRAFDPIMKTGEPNDVYTIAAAMHMIVYMATAFRRDLGSLVLPFLSFTVGMAREKQLSDERSDIYTAANTSEEMKEIMRRLWWSLYIIERSIVVAGNRPSLVITDLECRLRLPNPIFPTSELSPSLKRDAPFFREVMGHPLPSMMHYQARLAILTHLMGRVLELWHWVDFHGINLYDPATAAHPLVVEAFGKIRHLDAALNHWYQNLPDIYRIYMPDTTTAPHHLTFVLMYRTARIMLYAPRDVLKHLSSSTDAPLDADGVAEQLKAIGWLMSPHHAIAVEEALLAAQVAEIGLKAVGGAVEWTGFVPRGSPRPPDLSFVDFGTPLQSFCLFHIGMVHLVEARVLSGLSGCSAVVNDARMPGFVSGMDMVNRGFHDARVGDHLRATGIHITALQRFGVCWFHCSRLSGLLAMMLQQVVVTLAAAEGSSRAKAEGEDGHLQPNTLTGGKRLGSWGNFLALDGLQGTISTELTDLVLARQMMEASQRR